MGNSRGFSTGWDQFTVTSTGTGVAETELGSGINTPSQAQQIASIVPYGGATGAYTAAQAYVAEVAIRSDSIPLTPKRVVFNGGNGGVGTFIDVVVPRLEEWEFNTPIQAQSVVRCFGTAQTANTVAFDQGCAIQYSTLAPSYPEKFWTKMTDEVSTGTTATKVAGSSIQITTGTNAGIITDLWGEIFTAGVVTVSESYYGSMEFQSNDFDDAMPLRVPIQPMGVGLATSVPQMVKMARYSINKPTKQNTVINTSLFLDEALTAASAFIGGVGYIKA